MEHPARRFVSDKSSWRALAPWLGPPLAMQVALILLAVGYALYQRVS